MRDLLFGTLAKAVAACNRKAKIYVWQCGGQWCVTATCRAARNGATIVHQNFVGDPKALPL